MFKYTINLLFSKMILFGVLQLLILINLVFSEVNETVVDELGRGPCATIKDIHKCIAHKGCGFCVKSGYSYPNRCDSLRILKEVTDCEDDIFESDDTPHETHIAPNRTTDNVTVHLMPGMVRNITILVSLEAHPIDLYYLMDFSGSMSGDKSNLASIAEALKSTIGSITEDYRLGLGSFVDKPANGLGEPPNDYVYKNRMSLSHDTSQFAQLVRDTQILNGGDGPEATGEALLQAIVCKNEIGWRDDSRRFLLVATDVKFHVQGDGKIANIIKPNDGQCHLNATGDYTAQLSQDYPSISQLINVIQDNSIITIFAVRSKNDQDFYNDIVSKTKASSFVSLDADSKNVLAIIQQAYQEIHSRIELEHTKTTDELVVKFYSSCHGDDEQETNICDKLPKSGQVKFTVSIDLKSCPKDKADWNQKITVTPVGLPIRLEIEARLVCDI